MAGSSCFLQRYLCYLRALAIQRRCDMGNGQSGSRTAVIYLLMLSGNAAHDVQAVNAGTFSIIHCPTKGISSSP